MAPWRRFLPAFVALAALTSGIWLGRVTAQTPEPGSSADPLVSKSYVDQVLAALPNKAYVDQAVTALATKEQVGLWTAFRVVTVPAGQAIIGDGGTEIVLRGGQATAVTSAQGGLLNATSGKDMTKGEIIPPNNLIVIPRNDGRGFLAVTDLVLMVKGPASIGPLK